MQKVLPKLKTYQSIKKLARSLLLQRGMQTTFTSRIFVKIENRLNAVTDSLRGIIIALEFDKQQGVPVDSEEGFNVLLNLGGMLNTLSSLRVQIQRASAILPSPNAVAYQMAEQVEALGRDLFATLGHIRAIEGEITRVAYQRMDQIAA